MTRVGEQERRDGRERALTDLRLLPGRIVLVLAVPRHHRLHVRRLVGLTPVLCGAHLDRKREWEGRDEEGEGKWLFRARRLTREPGREMSDVHLLSTLSTAAAAQTAALGYGYRIVRHIGSWMCLKGKELTSGRRLSSYLSFAERQTGPTTSRSLVATLLLLSLLRL
jgi:hypothetical protein